MNKIGTIFTVIFIIFFLNSWIVSADIRSNLLSNLQNPVVNSIGNDQDSGELLWKFKTGGFVTDTPVFSDGIVYIGSGDHNLYALDAMKGNEIWQFSTEGDVNTPIVSHGVVYVTSGDQLYALDARSGNSIWQSAEENGNFNSIAIVENDILYVTSGGDNYNLYALDTNNGDVVWQFTEKVALGGPSVSNGIVYFSCRDGNFYALDSMTGNKLWHFTNEGDIFRSFSISNGIIYLTGAINKQNKSNIYALDAISGRKIWKVNIDVGAPWEPQIAQDVLCIGGMSNNVIGLDIKTGNKLWQFDIGAGITTGPTESNGVIYFGCAGNNNFYAIDISSGKKIWQFTAGDYTPGFPLISDGIVYYHCVDGNIYALDTENGSKIWQYAMDIGTGSGLEVTNGVVYCGSKDNNVYAIGIPDSQTLNSYQSSSITPTSLPSESSGITSAFSVTQTTGDSPMEVSFIDQSTGNPTTWLWDFGDGSTDVTQNPNHIYGSEGTYDVSLTVSDGEMIAIPGKKQVTVINTNFQSSEPEPQQLNGNFLPDLTITSSSISYKPDSSSILVNLTIKNQGGEKSGKFTITYFLAESQITHPFMDVRAREYILGTDDVNGLEPGAVRDERSTKNLPINKNLVPSGAYWFGIVIDSRNEIDELYEENNVNYGPESIKV